MGPAELNFLGVQHVYTLCAMVLSYEKVPLLAASVLPAQLHQLTRSFAQKVSTNFK